MTSRQPDKDNGLRRLPAADRLLKSGDMWEGGVKTFVEELLMSFMDRP